MDLSKIVEDLKKTVSDIKAAVDKNASPAEMEKRTKELVDAQLNARRDGMLAEIRKGRYSEQEADARPSQDLIVSKAVDPKVKALQEANDNMYILSRILKTNATNLKSWQKFAQGHSELKKAMDSVTASEGLEWIPTEFSAELIDRVRLATKAAGLFRRIQMPSDPYKIPGVSSDSTGYLVAEQTADDPAIASRTFTASKPGTTNITLNAVKLGARVNFSLELTEDSIIPVVDMIKDNMAIAMAFALEDAVINGDTAGTHFDSDVTSAADARKAWDGLRDAAQDANQVSLSTLSTANLRAMRGKMGKYGVEPSKLVWLCSAKGYVKMLSLAEVITVDKYGPQATVLSGELAKFDGIPIVLSEKVRDDLNTVGVHDSTTNEKGEILLVYVPGFAVGERRKMTMKSFEDIQNDQTTLVTSWRGDFRALYSVSTEPLVIEGVNLTV